jgi:DNA-binding transcriptional regulator YiaG
MKYRSDILETIHENAVANFEIGAISEKRMREFDEMCLAPETDADETSAVQKTKTERADFITA